MGEKTTTMGIFSSNCYGLSGGADRKNAVLPCGVGKYGVWPSSDMLMLWGVSAFALLLRIPVIVEEEVVERIFLDVELAYATIEEVAERFDVRPFACGDEDDVENVSCRRIVPLGSSGSARHPGLHQFVERGVFASGRRKVVLGLGGEGIGVHLVEDEKLRMVGTSEVAERTVHHLYLLLEVGMADVDDMYQQVGLAGFVEGALERFDEVGGKFADETYGVGKEEG